MAGKVLVVEDDDTIRNLLIEYLREQGAVTVEGARDGAEALHRLRAQPYSVVVLDLLMPHMSGVDLLDSLEAFARDPSLSGPLRRPAVLIITSTPEETLEDSAISRRYPQLVKGVLRKPIDFGKLSGRIEQLLSS